MKAHLASCNATLQRKLCRPYVITDLHNIPIALRFESLPSLPSAHIHV